MDDADRDGFTVGRLLRGVWRRTRHFRIEFGILVALFVVVGGGVGASFGAFAPPLGVDASGAAKPDELTRWTFYGLLFKLIEYYLNAALMVVWLRVLQLGVGEALAGGASILALRALRFFLRWLLTVLIAVAALMTLAVLIGPLLFWLFGVKGQLSLTLNSFLLLTLIATVVGGWIAIRLSFSVVTTAFDGRHFFDVSWRLTKGRSDKILIAALVLCLPMLFAETALLAQSLAPGVGGEEGQGVGLTWLVALALIDGVTAAFLGALLVEAFERLGAWPRPPAPSAPPAPIDESAQ